MHGTEATWKHVQETKQRILSRLKMPGEITTKADAAKAWQQYLAYDAMADRAWTKYMQAGIGTMTQRHHHGRWDAYSDAADAWRDALDRWFGSQHSS